ncbi:uncharacterized protein LOC128959538 [Oppia nitens]|uniref:uncharacterized protein LOC128959538 n=1 Tax=Oppia nitens TaxID=1686743 RepID=UPI0023DADB88|nr:uncharacterized protein LOC128959538 [Oppia nitens]
MKMTLLFKTNFINNLCLLLLLIINITKFAYSNNNKYNNDDQEKIKVKNWIVVDKGWPLQDNYDRYIRQRSWPFYFIEHEIKSGTQWKIGQQIIDEFKNKNNTVFRLSFKYWEYGIDWWPQTVVNADGYGTSDEITNLFFMYLKNYRKKDDTSGLQYWMPIEYSISYQQLSKFSIAFETLKNNNIVAFKDIKLEYLDESDNFEEDIYDSNYVYQDLKIDNKDYDTVYAMDSTHKDTYNMNTDYVYQIEYNYLGEPRDMEIIFEYRLSNDLDRIRNRFYSFRLQNIAFKDINLNLNEFLAMTGANFYIYAKIRYFKDRRSPPKSSIVTITKSTETTKKTTKYPKYLLPMKDGINWNKLIDGERNVWKEIPQIKDKQYFTFESNNIKFNAETNNEQIATASLVSQWIVWDKNLLTVHGQFQITVDNADDFHGFRVRPQLCDWLFRCGDAVIQSTVVSEDNKTRTFKFTFALISDSSNYVKLHFRVDYFRPSYMAEYGSNSTYLTQFSLKLLHFGDPCFPELQSSKCVGHYEECQSIDYSSNNYPNDPQCQCKIDYIQDKYCDKINYCEHQYQDEIIKPSISGRKYCNTKFMLKKYNCKPINNDFECLCGTTNNLPDPTDQLINWNAKEHKCEPIEITGNWEKTTDPKIFIAPEKQTNKLKVNFIPVLSDLDVCLEITTTIPNKIGINLDIQYEENNSILPSLFLSKTTSPQNFQLCLKDYIPNLPDKFSVHFLAPNNLDKNDLKIEIKAFLQIKKTATPFITNWNAMTIPETKDQIWTQFPNNKFGKFETDPITPKFKMNYNFMVNEKLIKTSHYLITPWISYNANFKTTPNYTFTIEFEDNNDKIGQDINVYLLYQNGNKITSEVLWRDSRHGTDIICKYIPEFSLNNIQGNDFKIIIEFQFNDKYDFYKKHQYPITVSDINIGDSCFDNVGRPVCNNDKCLRVKPNQFQCVCPQGLKGILCDEIDKCTLKSKIDGFTNQEYCKFFANADCQHLSADKFMCNCQQPYYQWNQDQLICEQKTFVKTKSKTCDKGKCVIFDSINTVMRSTNELMPTLNRDNYLKLLPFYLGFQNEGTIEIPVPKQKSSDPKLNVDTCLKLQYKLSTTKSKLMVAYNDNKPIELNTIEYKPDGELINWQNEIVCANQISKNVDEKSPIQTFILNPSIYSKDSDMVAVKIEQKFVDRSDGVPYEKLSPIPFLTAFSDNDKDINFTARHQWVTQFPYKIPNDINKPYWSFTNKYKVSVITFSPQVQTIDSNYVSTLYSNWIDPGQQPKQFIMNFVINNDYKDFVIEFLLFDKHMNEITHNTVIGDPMISSKVDITYKKGSKVSIDFGKQLNIFKIGLRATYRLPKVLTQLIQIESLTAGDPCYDRDNRHFCHGNGVCISRYPYTPKTTTCNCYNGFTQLSHCKIQDFCLSTVELPNGNTGYDYCRINYLGQCISNTYNSYKCDCNNTNIQYYDNRILTCVSLPKCLITSCSDPLTQQCVETRDGPKCKCIFNERVQYYDENDGIGELKCVAFDYCNSKHQLLLPTIYRNPDPCGTAKDNTKCLSFNMLYKNNKWITDYTCVCKPGYETINDGNKVKCISHLCDLSAANNCAQKCSNDDNNFDGYTCDCDSKYTKIDDYNCQMKSGLSCDCSPPAWCGSDGKCQCKHGFKVDDSGKKCIQSSILVDKSVCINGKTKLRNNELVCDCPHNYTLLGNGMCKPIDVCADGQIGQQICVTKNASCILNAKQPDQYECHCLSGKYRNIKENQYESNRTVCIDNCRYERRNDICDSIDAVCDPTVQPKSGEQMTDFCLCKPGYKWTTNSNFMRCETVDKIIKFTVNIKSLNTFLSQSYVSPIDVHSDAYSDAYDYIDVLKTEIIRNTLIERSKSGFYYKELVKSDILAFMRLAINSTSFRPDNYRENPVNVAIDSCNYNQTTEYYKCVFVLSLDKSVVDNKPLQLIEEIKKLCYTDVNNKLCFFPIRMQPLPPPSPRPMRSISVPIVDKWVNYDIDDDIQNYFTKQDMTYIIELDSMSIL